MRNKIESTYFLQASHKYKSAFQQTLLKGKPGQFNAPKIKQTESAE